MSSGHHERERDVSLIDGTSNFEEEVGRHGDREKQEENKEGVAGHTDEQRFIPNEIWKTGHAEVISGVSHVESGEINVLKGPLENKATRCCGGGRMALSYSKCDQMGSKRCCSEINRVCNGVNTSR